MLYFSQWQYNRGGERMKDTKDKRLNIRIDKEFKSEIEQAADEVGLTLSALTMMLLKKWLREQQANKK